MLSSWPINIPSFSLTEALLLADVIRSQVQNRRRKTRSDGIGEGWKVCASEWKETDALQTEVKELFWLQKSVGFNVKSGLCRWTGPSNHWHVTRDSSSRSSQSYPVPNSRQTTGALEKARDIGFGCFKQQPPLPIQNSPVSTQKSVRPLCSSTPVHPASGRQLYKVTLVNTLSVHLTKILTLCQGHIRLSSLKQTKILLGSCHICFKDDLGGHYYFI